MQTISNKTTNVQVSANFFNRVGTNSFDIN